MSRSLVKSRKNGSGSGPDESTPLLGDLLIPPHDKWTFVGAIFCFLGMTTMLPWNFLISISSFWDFKFRNITDDSNLFNGGFNHTLNQAALDTFELPPFHPAKPTPLQVEFPSYLAIASNIPGAITTIVHSLFGQKVSVSSRILWALSILFGAFVGLLLISIPNSDEWQGKFLHLVLMLVVLTNVGVNVLQGAMFGVSGRFPPVYAGFVMTGQALGGVVPAVAAIALISMKVQPWLLGPACFGSNLALILAAILAYKTISRNDFFRYYAEGKSTSGSPSRAQATDEDDSESYESESDDSTDENEPTSRGNREDHESNQLTEPGEGVKYCHVFARSWMYFVTGFINYCTTLCVFPALTSLGRTF